MKPKLIHLVIETSYKYNKPISMTMEYIIAIESQIHNKNRITYDNHKNYYYMALSRVIDKYKKEVK